MNPLEYLARFGEVALFNHGKGWSCTCDMFVQGQGVKVEVKSERNHTSHAGAAQQCLDRCIDCIAELKHKTQKIEAKL